MLLWGEPAPAPVAAGDQPDVCIEVTAPVADLASPATDSVTSLFGTAVPEPDAVLDYLAVGVMFRLAH